MTLDEMHNGGFERSGGCVIRCDTFEKFEYAVMQLHERYGFWKYPKNIIARYDYECRRGVPCVNAVVQGYCYDSFYEREGNRIVDFDDVFPGVLLDECTESEEYDVGALFDL